ncbi:MAG TPA: hypothetical protein VGP22_05755, partial [Albitalea sp.]|nr:hypothetical protein [Albitalea sp.]
MKLSGVLPRRAPCAAVVAAAAVAGCGWLAPPPPAPTPSPNDACRALNESLAAAVPPGESLAELQARGVRVQTPLSFPPGTSPRPAQPSGAVVQMLIGVDGSVVPGSPKIVKSVGEAQVASAMEAAALSMRFE